ncbi:MULTISPECIES: tol-pal system-associated acyl-CoA thioesterase [unclassified Elioraea]|jgi:acyl-CoA thioester hydrolase|uniref:tol-pal system-associated acyl-CoA thioesterase n=1 Tax=unclassified Elioraea TaxID=2619524 RepID=UPI0011516673|nr:MULTISPECIES: tol-pal system-associated acyl-CoA thioesterase [unclassified Elioraea]TQF76797.1 tol-pal system-associated acyl-CoA thioesterase [Elioraea sp. Yellowstone]GIX11225.1 MAG: tol-pal system-associated acyl-CoA thioesterase [Elioraea sp.]
MAEHPAHRFALRVYFEDTDAGGIVYHAAHLRFAERARTEWLRDLGLPHRQLIEAEGLIFVVKRLAIEYHRPARLDESLAVVTHPRHIGAASVTLEQAIRRGEEAIATLEVVLACVRLATGRPERIPAALRAALAAHP